MQYKLINFSTYSSIKIGAPLNVALIQTLQDAFDCLSENYRIIGKANNLLISPQAKKLAILDKSYNYIQDNEEYIEIGGALASGRIFSYFKSHNLAGAEFLQALPGSLGGLIKMNAGMKQYEMKNLLQSINVNGQWHNTNAFPMEYRYSGIEGIILAGRFYKRVGFDASLQAEFIKMRQTHPKEPSCGSCFKNPHGDYAGRLLESVGLKGYRLGGVAFSEKHANFLINVGNATFDEAISLIKLAQKRVYETNGIQLEPEIQIIE
ncbi:UDP-N-acetylmuramate dehydrogenase [Helicobacter sp. MIT 05-5293]|uniref:UDP-N-acetylmuramate dehydrogenase n=1 Tax=Helicobacter sp. MIT 05-5293 TaxID=1548149 RepID=UPI0010FCEFDA|nr:UDP-N-acetylmuramate dehydrogenase [Helicobacter sp. MIT 05-5293]TLD81744.1 UDP-N-acetylmuramate dehydrogenase [Helicobacter sp. MIT 05-5293]